MGVKMENLKQIITNKTDLSSDSYRILDLYGGRGIVGENASKRVPNRNIEYTLIDANASPGDLEETELFHPNIIHGTIRGPYQEVLDAIDNCARETYDEIHLHMVEAMSWQVNASEVSRLKNRKITLTDIQTIEAKLREGGRFYHTFQRDSPFYNSLEEVEAFEEARREEDYIKFQEVIDKIKKGTDLQTEEAWLIQNSPLGHITSIKVGENELYSRNEGEVTRPDKGYVECIKRLLDFSIHAPSYARGFIQLKK